MPVPFLGELVGPLRVLLRALPLREAVEVLAQSLNERITPAFYRIELPGDGATTKHVRNALKINKRMGPFLVVDMTIGNGTEGTELLDVNPDEDDAIANTMIIDHASGALIAPIPVRKSLEVSLTDPTQESPIGANVALVVNGYHMSARMLAAVEKSIGASWSTALALRTDEPTRYSLAHPGEIIGIRAEDTTADDLSIHIAGRYLFPQGFGAGDLAPLLAGQGHARRLFDSGFVDDGIAERGLWQMPTAYQAGDELFVHPATSTGDGPIYLTIFGRIRR